MILTGVGLLLVAAILAAYVAQPGSTALAPQMQSHKEIFYVPGVSQHSLALDLHIPKGPGGPFPLVVYIHGGGWVEGDKAVPFQLVLVPRGFAFASINYRLTSEAAFPAQIFDCKAAIRWLRAHAKEYNIDPDRIGVMGHSAGGHLAALCGTTNGVKYAEGDEGNLNTSSAVQAVCDLAGPTDLLSLPPAVKPHEILDPEDPNGLITKFLGGPLKNKKDLARLADPDTFITKDDPPFLIIHGEKDNVVPLQQSQELYRNLQSAGVESTLIVAQGAGHDLFTLEILDKVCDFFSNTLKKPVH